MVAFEEARGGWKNLLRPRDSLPDLFEPVDWTERTEPGRLLAADMLRANGEGLNWSRSRSSERVWRSCSCRECRLVPDEELRE